MRTEVDTRTEMDSEAGSFRDVKSPSKSVRVPIEDPAVRSMRAVHSDYCETLDPIRLHDHNENSGLWKDA